MLHDILHLIFPESCLACGAELTQKEKHLCVICKGDLHYSNMHLLPKADNPIEKLFWGRIPLTFGYAHLQFEKKSLSQKVLFRIKYKSDRKLAVYFGEQIGAILKLSNASTLPDLMIPVPLHHRKKFIRGYNQSEELAKGIAQSSGITLDTTLVTRSRFTETQTRKGRFERWNNLNNAFQVNTDISNYKHILLVDDVTTTGSTLEQIYLELKKIHPTVQVSIVTLAIA